jgi:diguanylate cyclase (GGDEF)-like protein
MPQIAYLKRKIRQLEKLVYKDELTKVYNRRGFLDLTKKILKELFSSIQDDKRKKVIIKNYSLILFDIDDFKKINDTFGHDIGDKILKIVCNEIKKRIRDFDVIGRWGGEEIVVLLVEANISEAYQIADYIRGKIANKKIKYDGKQVNLTVSAGVSDFSREKDFEKVFKLADEALYKAKQTGKNKVVMAK